MFKSMQNGQNLFTAINIPSRRFTQFLSAGPNTKQVIANLKGNTHCIPKAAQTGNCFCIACPNERAHLSGAAHQCGSLAAYHVHVHRNGNIIMRFKADIEVLALRNHEAGLVKNRPKTDSDGGVHPLVYYIPEHETSKSKHTIACINRLWNTPDVPECWAVAALGISIFNIVVN